MNIARRALALSVVLALPLSSVDRAAAQVFGRAASAGTSAVPVLPALGDSFGALSAPSLAAPSLPAPSLSAGVVPAPTLTFAAPAALSPVVAAAVKPAAPVAPIAAATPFKAATPVTPLLSAAKTLSAAVTPEKPGAPAETAAPALEAFYSGSAATPEEPAPVPAVGAGEFGSTSDRVGVRYGGGRYLLRRAFASSFHFLNTKLGVQWYDLPPSIGVFNLAAIETRMRLDNVYNTEAYAHKDPKAVPAPTQAQLESQDPAGKYHDLKDPNMGSAGTRFGRLSEPSKHGADVSPKLLERMGRISEVLFKRTKFVPALILNDHAAFWIQAMVHDWMNHKRRPISEDPMKVPLPAGHPMGEKEMTVDRTASDATRKDGEQPPTFENTETHWWDLSMIYGSSPETLAGLRDGGYKLVVEDDGRLPEDPSRPGVDKTGFNMNYSVGLAILHTIFAKEHNAIADALKAKYPQWSDDKVFRQARMINVAFAAKVHTVEWTRALLPNRTLHVGMWADWYGFLGKRAKLWLMRRVYPRFPGVKTLFPILNHEWMVGVPSTPVEHFSGPFAMPEEFVEVYRLHNLLPDEYPVSSLMSRKLLANLSLTEIQGKYTRGVTEKFSWEDLASSFGRQSAGALVLHNFPEALRKLRTMDDRYLDMAVMDMLRLHERAPELTFNEFLRRIGMAAPKTFLELTGGDEAAAKTISELYDGDIEQVDLQVGLAAVKKPQGFAISDPAFRIFILMAPRRLKSDRFLSELYKPEVYTQLGIDWIEHNTFMDAAARHYPALRKALEGHDNFFSPWPTTPLRDRLYAKAAQSAAAMTSRGALNAGVGIGLSALAWALGASAFSVLSLALIPALGAVVAWRMSSMGEFAHVARYAESDIRLAQFRPLYRAEARAKRGALAALFGAFTTLDVGGMLAWHLLGATPVLAAVIGLLAVWSGLKALRAAKSFKKDVELLRVGLYGNLNEGRAKRAAADLPGATALEKHARYFSGGSEVETFAATYRNVRATGQSRFASFTTAVSWHLVFARKTQKTMTEEQKAAFKPRFFDVFTPNIELTQGAAGNGLFAHETTPAVRRGDLDRAEVDRVFREFAVGRDYLTEYDVIRMQEANWDRDTTHSWLAKKVGLFASKKRFRQLFARFADRVAYEDEKDGRLVKAISREQFVYFFEGGLKYDVAEDWSGGHDAP